MSDACWRGYGAGKASLTGAFGVLYRPGIENDPEAATNYVTELSDVATLAAGRRSSGKE